MSQQVQPERSADSGASGIARFFRITSAAMFSGHN